VRGGSPSRSEMMQTAQAGGFIHRSVRRSGSRCKPVAVETVITGRYGKRCKPKAGRAGRSREDRFPVSRELIVGRTGEIGIRRKLEIRLRLTEGLRTRRMLEIGSRRCKSKDA